MLKRTNSKVVLALKIIHPDRKREFICGLAHGGFFATCDNKVYSKEISDGQEKNTSSHFTVS